MNFIQELSNRSSRIDKENYIQTLSKEHLKVFYYAYNPYYMYGITNFNVDLDNIGTITEEGFELLNKLINRELTGNLARQRVLQYAEVWGDLIKLICMKDLKCGVSATTINKVYPRCIPQFKVQLAKEVPLSKIDFPCYAQLKYDGVRLIAIKYTTGVKFYTRNGKLVNLPYLASVLENFDGPLCVLDGEITLGFGKQDERTKVSGLINSAIHGGTIDESKLVYNIFDIMDTDDWHAGKCNVPFFERNEAMITYLSMLGHLQFQPVVSHFMSTIEQVQYLYKSFIKENFEGLILKPSNHLYTFKRSKDWVKVKETKTADLVCNVVEYGTGKYYNAIGSLNCSGTVEGKQIQVNVGSGLTDYDRYLKHSHYLGKTIEVKYNSLIQDSITKRWSLFLPRFVQVRIDK